MRVRRLENKSEVHDTSNRGVKPQQNGICQASTEPPPMGRPRSLAHRVVVRTVCSCTVKLYRVLGTPPAGLLDKVNQLYDDRFDRRTGFFWGRPSRRTAMTAVASSVRLQITPLTGCTGAEISGVDLRTSIWTQRSLRRPAPPYSASDAEGRTPIVMPSGPTVTTVEGAASWRNLRSPMGSHRSKKGRSDGISLFTS